MKTRLPSSRILFTKITFLICLLTTAHLTQAQNVSMTVTKQPCNHDGEISATVSGMTGPYTFQWYTRVGITTQVQSGPTATFSNYAGGYLSLYVYNAASDVATNSISASPFSYKVTTTNAACPSPGQAQATVTGGTPPFTYQWYKGTIGNIIATGNPVFLKAAYDYGVQITDSKGCVFGSAEQMDSVAIYDSKAPQVNLNTTPANCTNGSISIGSVTGAVPPNTYLWSNGSTANQLNNLIQGYYSVVVTDSRGCAGTGYASVAQAVTVNANVVSTDAACVQNNGSATTFGSGGGTPPYSYLYSNGQTTQTVTNLAPNSYSVKVTDVNGCVGSSWFSIAATTPISVTYTSTSSSCTAPTGTATLSILGGTTPYAVNWGTAPAQTGSTANNLSSGLYSFNVTDALGCIQSGTVYVPTISGLNGYEYATQANCPVNDGTASVILLAGAPPYTYAWSNGATTAVINNLPAGSYACTVTDAMSCSVTKYGWVRENSSMSLGFSMTPASCIFNSDGSLDMSVTGGIAPYTVYWSNGETTMNANSLSTGHYSVWVTDSKGCTASQEQIFVDYNAANNSCYCTIMGTVFDDANKNCVQDPGEAGIQNIMINNNSTGYTFTDANGNYSMIVPSGTYNVQEMTNNLYPLAPCQSNTNPVVATAASGCTFTVNFANVINPLHDIHLLTFDLTQPVPGYTYNQRTVVENDGTVTENAIVMGYANDGQLGYSGSSALTLTQPNSVSFPDWYAIQSGFPALNAAQFVSTDLSYNVPANIPLGTSVIFYDTAAYQAPIINWLSDYSPWNNLNHLTSVVVGSFDPNFVEVLPKGSGSLGYINTKDSILSYIIHFQNTGTAPAQKVVVKVKMDPNLNMQTLRPGYATSPFSTTMDPSGNVSFTFNNINLADSSSNPITSIGIVSYSVHLKKNASGTQYKAKASIYFDYNAPVVTNTTLNTMASPEGITENKTAANTMSLYPNPASDAVNLKIISQTEGSGNPAKLGLYSINGELILEQKLTLNKESNLYSISTAEIPTGLYFVRITDSSGQQVSKLSIAR